MIIQIVSLYLFVAVIVTSILFTFAISKSRSNYLRILAVLLFFVNIYIFGYLLELNSTTLEQMRFWNLVEYIGLAFYPALWLMVGLMYTGRIQKIVGLKGLAVFIIPTLTLIIRATNNYHHLYYISMKLQQNSEFWVMSLEKGPWFYVQSMYILIALVLNLYVYILEYKKRKVTEKLKIRLILIASLLPFLGLILIIINIWGLGLDYTALISPVSVCLILYALIKYDFLEVKVLAREKIFEDSMDGLILINTSLRVMDYNCAGKTYFSWMDIELKMESLEKLLIDQQKLFDNLKHSITQKLETKENGKDRILEISSKEIGKNQNHPLGKVITIKDITQREELQKHLKRLANMDELSGLENRRSLMKQAFSKFESAKKEDISFAVVMMDFDNFKEINDTFGHGGGDLVIREFSCLMKQLFSDTDILGRMGGEEFAVILADTTADEVYQKVERFRLLVELKQVIYLNQIIRFSVSIGVAMMKENTKDIDEVFRHADKALYLAKANGRNQTEVFNE